MENRLAPVIVLNWDSSEPVYGQIARQLRTYIASGQLPAGAPMPPVRSIASDLGINLNTVARAYRVLEEEHFILIRDRSGATVAPPVQDVDKTRLENLCEELKAVLARMKQAGLTVAELRRHVERQLANLE